MTEDQMMCDAIEVAREAMHCGEAPIGVVLFTGEGERVAQGWNQRRSTGNTLRHGEIVAFDAASQPGQTQPKDLILVGTLEPCVMCWGACLELNVSKLVYGLEAPTNGGSSRVDDPDRRVEVSAKVLRNDCRQLFVDWLDENPDHAGSAFVEELLQTTA
ncbi:MAG: nucleoside deaminase [Planctomycetota bacterium]